MRHKDFEILSRLKLTDNQWKLSTVAQKLLWLRSLTQLDLHLMDESQCFVCDQHNGAVTFGLLM